MAALRTYWIPLMLVAILACAAATVWNIVREIGQPFGGFYTTTAHVWQVDAPTPPWWPALNASGLRYDDELVALEDLPYGPDSYLAYARALAAGRHAVTLTINRGGVTSRLDIPIRIFTVGNFLDLKLPDLLVGLGFWLLAAAVYLAQPRGPVNRIFAVACSLTAGAIWLTIPALFPQADWLTHTLELGWVFSAAFVGVAFIHLATLFPDPVHRDAMRWIKALYIFMALTAGMYSLALVLRWHDGSSPFAEWVGTLSNTIVIGVFGLAVAIYLARLLRLLWQPVRSRRVRRQVILLFSGLALALPYVLVVVIRALVHQNPGSLQSYFWNELDLRYLVLAVPLTLAFVILRYQSFQRTPLPIIGVLILATSAFAGSLGAWVVRILDPQWVNSLTWTPFLPLFGVALVSSIFWSSQSSWWGAFSRLFQWERRSYTAVRKFGQHVLSEIELTRLPQTIAQSLVNNMELERAAIWLWDEKVPAYVLAGQAGDWSRPAPPQLFPDPLPTTSRSIRIQAQDPALPAWLTPLSGEGMIEIATPLAISGSPIGLLGSGKRWDEEIFDDRDIQITELIAQQAGLFLLTSLQIEQLRHVPQEIATAQERERFKIAQELHDTVQQFLGRLPFFLEVSRSSARSNPAETEAILQRCIADVDAAAKAVRQIRNNLAPLQLEKSLSLPLRALAEQFSDRNQIAVQLSASPEADTRLSAESRHALYRVVQQALDNIAAHAHAGRVIIDIGPAHERIQFAITDDGSGFDATRRAGAEESGSFGLKSMEARITSQGGEFSIRTRPGAGTTVAGWLPMLPPTHSSS